MSLVKGKYPKKYTQIGLLIFAIVLVVTFIQFRTMEAISVNDKTVYTTVKTVDIRLDDVVSGDKVYIVVNDDKNRDTYKKLNSEPCNIKFDITGKYITTELPSEKNGDVHDVILAFNMEKDSDIKSNEVTHVQVVVDTQAPEAVGKVNIISSNSNNTLAKNDDIITLTFTTNEVVKTPTVLILGKNAKVTENETRHGNEKGTSWKATYIVSASDTTQDDVKFTINYNDLTGNALEKAVDCTNDDSKVICDNKAPTASPVSITNTISSGAARTYAKNGDKITITFTTSERVQMQTSTILGKEVDVKDIGVEATKGTLWKAEYIIDDEGSTIPDGLVNFSMKFKDEVGNEVATPVIATTDTTKVTYDNKPTAGSVNIVSSNIDKTLAKNGDTITIMFKTSKKATTSAVDVPVVKIHGMPAVVTDTEYVPATVAVGNVDAKLAVPGNGTSWKAEYIILAAEATIPEKKIEFSIKFKDILGNEVASEVTSTTDNSNVTYDRTAPKADRVSITSSNNLTDYVKNGQKIFVSFKTDEIIKNPSATIFGRTATVNGKDKNWTAEYSIPDNESDLTEILAPFKIGFTDLSGNIATDVVTVNDEPLSSVKYDRVAPITPTTVKLTSSNANVKQAKNGDTITLDITSAEPIQKPDVTIFGINISKDDIEDTNKAGTIWKAKYTVNPKDSEINDGNVEFEIKIMDLSSNAFGSIVKNTTDGSSVNYESIIPRASLVTMVSNNDNKIFARNGDKITTTFVTTKAVQKPKVKIHGRDADTVDSVAGKENTYIAEYTIPADEKLLTEGKIPLSITLLDVANIETVINAVTDSSTVTYDRTKAIASAVNIATNNANPRYAKNGDKITIAIDTSEKVQVPIVAIFDTVPDKITEVEIKDSKIKNGTSWIAEYTVKGDEKEGNVNFSIKINDFASNSASVTKSTDGLSVTYDRQAPTATIVKLTSNNKNIAQSKDGDTVTAEITTSEFIQKPIIKIFGIEVDVTGRDNSWKAEYKIDSTKNVILDGTASLDIKFNDLANNEAVPVVTTTDKSSVNYEGIPPLAPTVSISSNNSNSIFAKNGDKVTVNFVTSKYVQTPTVKIHGRDASVVEVAGKTNTWVAQYDIPVDENTLEQGSMSVSINLLDIANNETQIDAVTDSSTVTYDRTEAIASNVNITSNNLNPIYAKNGDKLTIEFNTSEKVQTPIATILGRTSKIAESKIKDGTSWIAEYTINDDEKLLFEGKVDFLINFKDLAGNDAKKVLTPASDKNIITYDRTAAKATSVKLNSTNSNTKYAKNGDKVTAKFTTSEVVQSPKVTIQGNTVAVDGDGSGKNWTSEYNISDKEASLAEGNIGFTMFFKDLANNEVTTPVTSTDDNSSVNYDRTSPTSSKIGVEKVTGTSYSNIVKDGDKFKVKFTLNDTNSGIEAGYVKTQVGKTSLIAPITKGTALNGEYEAVFTVDDNTLLGIDDYASFNYVVNFRDAAGNYGLNINNAGISNDNIDPEIRFFMNGVDTNSSELKPYYKENKLIIQVKEHNFDVAQAILENSQIKQTSWVSKGNDIWQMAVTVPDGDNYKLKVNVTDKAGNLGSNNLTSERAFNIDTTVPQIKYMFNGKETDATSRYYKTVQQVALQVKEHNFNPATTTVSGNGIKVTSWKNKGNDIWEMDLTLGDANDYTLNLTTTDKAENKFDKNLGTFTIDTIKPALSIKNIMSGFFNGSLSPKVVYSDKNLDKNAVSIKFNGKEIGLGTAVGNGFENTVNIKKDGKYNLVASVLDLAGNPSTAEIQFVLDNTAPHIGSTTINLKDPMAFKGGWIIQKELQISDLNGYDIVTCTLNGVDWDISKPITNEGKNVLYLEVKDKSGNMSKLTYQFFLDNTAPKLIFKDTVSNKSIDNSSGSPIFVSQMKLKIALDKMEIGNEKPDYFASIVLKDKDGNVISDILHSVTPEVENNLNVYYLPLSKFQTYTLSVMAKDQVGNDLNKTYTFTLKDKSMFAKYYANKPLLYTTTSLATVIAAALIWLGIIKLNKKKLQAIAETKAKVEE